MHPSDKLAPRRQIPARHNFRLLSWWGSIWFTLATSPASSTNKIERPLLHLYFTRLVGPDLGLRLLHASKLSATFLTHSPWYFDYAKYTDEGWYSNSAIRAHLFGNWYLPGDFNPGPALPVWPFLEWALFLITGVSVHAARGLAIAFFFANLVLSYFLLRTRGPLWIALLAVSLMVTSPFLYSFGRLAILEPVLLALTLAALNLAIRLPRFRHPIRTSMVIGLLFASMILTKTTGVFLLPALGTAILLTLWKDRGLALRCILTIACSSAIAYGLWMAVVMSSGKLADFRTFFSLNTFSKPDQSFWPLRILHGISHIAFLTDPISFHWRLWWSWEPHGGGSREAASCFWTRCLEHQYAASEAMSCLCSIVTRLLHVTSP